MGRDNRIGRHPAATRLLVATLSVVLLLVVREKACELKKRGMRRRSPGTERHIRFCEHNPHAFQEIHDSFNQVIRDTAAEHGILLIDLDREIPKDRKYIYSLIHCTDSGSELAATVITEELLKVVGHYR